MNYLQYINKFQPGGQFQNPDDFDPYVRDQSGNILNPEDEGYSQAYQQKWHQPYDPGMKDIHPGMWFVPSGEGMLITKGVRLMGKGLTKGVSKVLPKAAQFTSKLVSKVFPKVGNGLSTVYSVVKDLT